MPSFSSHRSFDNFGLQLLALAGDDEGVREAVESGANVNAYDASGRSALMCAIAGQHWNDITVSHDASYMTPSRLRTIDFLIRRPEISLFTLNAPQSADVTPLGMAAWLNMPEAVRVLLESSADSVAVDGMDNHGSTPLMYAARDGHFDIVKSLLQRGARPDLRALNHRSSIHYALAHPQILYLCESMLRQHRLHEWKLTEKISEPDSILRQSAVSLPMAQSFDSPPASVFGSTALTKATESIIDSLHSDFRKLCSLIFAPYVPPSSPSSAYPLSCPPLVNHSDGNGWSPIHHCASMLEPSVQVLDALYCAGADSSLVTVKEQYTALHCVAISDHYTSSPDTLYQYIFHLVHDLRAPLSARDKHGNTCIHIAAERSHSIEVLEAFLKCDTSNSVRDICNAKGFTALEVSKPEFRRAFGIALEETRPESSLSTNTLRPVQSPLESFLGSDLTLRGHGKSMFSSDFDVLSAARRLIDDLRISSPSIYHNADLRHVSHLESLMTEMDQLGMIIVNHLRARTQEVLEALNDLDGEAQETTALLSCVVQLVNDKLQDRGLQPWTRIRVSEDTCVNDSLSAISASTGELKTKSVLSTTAPEIRVPDENSSPGIDSNSSSSIDAEKKTSLSTTSKLVAWIKRKSSLNAVSKPPSGTLPPLPSPAKKEVEVPPSQTDGQSDLMEMTRSSGDAALRTSGTPLNAAGQDLERIRECLASAKELLDSASRSISRTDRVLIRAMKARKSMIKSLQKADDDLFIRSPEAYNLSNKSSLASIASISTVASQDLSSENPLSFTGILAENDDEETRAIRRLLLRKIDARHNGVLDEIEKIVGWLRVVKEVIRGVKRRTYV